jgi:hypothetical protein
VDLKTVDGSYRVGPTEKNTQEVFIQPMTVMTGTNGMTGEPEPQARFIIDKMS